MKKLLFILLFFVCLVSFGQDEKLGGILPMKDKKVTYTNVVQVDSTVTAKELYMRAKLWLTDTYKFSNDIIQSDDTETNQVVAKGMVKVAWQANFASNISTNLYHTVIIHCKDGRYRYEISDFKAYYRYGRLDKFEDNFPLEHLMEVRKDNAKKYYANVDAELSKVIASMEKAMKIPIIMKKPSKSDW